MILIPDTSFPGTHRFKVKPATTPPALESLYELTLESSID
jgi:hypothetical protein